MSAVCALFFFNHDTVLKKNYNFGTGFKTFQAHAKQRFTFDVSLVIVK